MGARAVLRIIVHTVLHRPDCPIQVFSGAFRKGAARRVGRPLACSRRGRRRSNRPGTTVRGKELEITFSVHRVKMFEPTLRGIGPSLC